MLINAVKRKTIYLLTPYKLIYDKSARRCSHKIRGKPGVNWGRPGFCRQECDFVGMNVHGGNPKIADPGV
jgi:hypothetical protein